MSKAISEAHLLPAMAVAFTVVSVAGVPRHNGWEYVATPFVVVLLVLGGSTSRATSSAAPG